MENNYWILRECQSNESSWESIDFGISNKYQFDISAEIICFGRLFVSISVFQVQRVDKKPLKGMSFGKQMWNKQRVWHLNCERKPLKMSPCLFNVNKH